jgi:hypothetical protein
MEVWLKLSLFLRTMVISVARRQDLIHRNLHRSGPANFGNRPRPTVLPLFRQIPAVRRQANRFQGMRVAGLMTLTTLEILVIRRARRDIGTRPWKEAVRRLAGGQEVGTGLADHRPVNRLDMTMNMKRGLSWKPVHDLARAVTPTLKCNDRFPSKTN